MANIDFNPDIEGRAKEWVQNNLQPWSGTLEDLNGKIAVDVIACGQWVKDKTGWLTNKNNCVKGCQGAIDKYYQETRNNLSTSQQHTNNVVNSNIIATLNSQKYAVYIYIGVAAFVIILLILIL